MDIIYIVYLFYLLEEMYSYIISDTKSYYHSHEKFEQDFMDFRTKFHEKFKLMSFDYAMYVIMAEVIDSVEQCDMTFDRILGHNPSYISHMTLKKEYMRIDPKDVLTRASELFFDCEWTEQFGDYAWGDLCEFILNNYNSMSPLEYLDSLIDMQHNTDSVLTKHNPFWKTSEADVHRLTSMLNLKRKHMPWYNINNLCKRPKSFILPLEMRKLMLRFVNLYESDWNKDFFYHTFWKTLMDWSPRQLEYGWSEVFNYKPVKYTKEFKLGKLVSSEPYDSIWYD